MKLGRASDERGIFRRGRLWREASDATMRRQLENRYCHSRHFRQVSGVDFEWDHRKNAANIAKHGVAFDVARTAFEDPGAVVAFDSEHSERGELRWWLLGKVDGRVLLVRYTHRPSGRIRILGAGFWRIGKDLYEKAHRKG